MQLSRCRRSLRGELLTALSRRPSGLRVRIEIKAFFRVDRGNRLQGQVLPANIAGAGFHEADKGIV